MSNPFHLSDIVAPGLDGVINALSDRPGLSQTQRQARANEMLMLILSFAPRDVIEMMLSGQTVLFNELLADGARDVFRGMVDTMKSRGVSNLINMARIVHGNVDRLAKRGHEAALAEAEAYAEDEAMVEVDDSPEEVPERHLPEAEAITEEATSGAEIPAFDQLVVPARMDEDAEYEPPIVTHAETPEAETSWLDEPFEQWVIETPADLAARLASAPEIPVATPKERGHRAPRPGPLSPSETEPALPRQPSGYPRGRILEEARAAGD